MKIQQTGALVHMCDERMFKLNTKEKRQERETRGRCDLWRHNLKFCKNYN